MRQVAIAIVVGAAVIAAAVLYASGKFDPVEAVYPFDAAMRDLMFDADSIRYRGVIVDQSFGGLLKNPMHCGEVTAKNLMGGYVGWKKFVAIDPDQSGDWSIHFTEAAKPFSTPWCSG